jgi:hypothetical protein
MCQWMMKKLENNTLIVMFQSIDSQEVRSLHLEKSTMTIVQHLSVIEGARILLSLWTATCSRGILILGTN